MTEHIEYCSWCYKRITGDKLNTSPMEKGFWFCSEEHYSLYDDYKNPYLGVIGGVRHVPPAGCKYWVDFHEHPRPELDQESLYRNYPPVLREATLRYGRAYQVWVVYGRDSEEYEAATNDLLAAMQEVFNASTPA